MINIYELVGPDHLAVGADYCLPSAACRRPRST